MPGPAAKSSTIVLPAAGRNGDIPEPTGVLSVSARNMWDAWWRSPMATMWDPTVDVFVLTRLAQMYDHAQSSGVSDRVTVEMRQLEGTFGLSPKGRKELGWVIESDAATVVSPADEIERKRKERRARLAAG
jgi:hypothetical protein